MSRQTRIALAATELTARLSSSRKRLTANQVAELRGGNLLVLGLGAIGTEVARLAKAFGMWTIGINRGGVIDEPALVQALRKERLSGAALGVVPNEPPPTDSPLWDLPNVLISPQTAARSVYENEHQQLFCENLRRYLAGQKLLSRVDPTLFY